MKVFIGMFAWLLSGDKCYQGLATVVLDGIKVLPGGYTVRSVN